MVTSEQGVIQRNWSGNIEFPAARFHQPGSVAELQRIVAAAEQVRMVGAAHSFNDIVSTRGDLISLGKMRRVVGLDRTARTVTFEAGISHRELAVELEASGFALANLPSLPHFNVVGASSTGTHGSGDGNQCLAAAIVSMDLVTAAGDLVTVAGSELDAMAVGLGAFGAITAMTVAIEPSYVMAQEIYLDVPRRDAFAGIDEMMSSAYSVSWFTDWQTDHIQQVWRKHRLDGVDPEAPKTPDRYFGGRSSNRQLAPSGPQAADSCTTQLMVPGPWHTRLPHVRADAELGSQLQTEFFVARRHGPAALEAIAGIGPKLSHLLRDGIMSEIRSVASDDLWLSPFAEDSLALHFSWWNDPAAVDEALSLVEAALEPFEPRPHWGKLHTLSARTIRSRYPRFGDFVALADRYDPEGRFRNDYLRELFG